MSLSPLPDLPSTPPVPGYWAVLDLEIIYGSPTSTIAILTDSPVTLWMHATTAEPHPEYVRALLRGAWLLRHVKWRSPSGFWFPQQGTRDSTTHTFLVADWPVGTGLWYYFDGLQNGRPTVSSSILFGSAKPPTAFTPGQQVFAQAILSNPLYRPVQDAPKPTASLTPV